MSEESWDRFLNPDLTPAERAVHVVLRRFYDALQDGTSESILPDFSYPRQWTTEELDAYVTELDAYVWKQAQWVAAQRKIVTDAGPGYSRLAEPQRLALLQQLHGVLAQYEEPKVEPPPST